MAFVITAIAAEAVTVASVAAAVGELGMTLSVVGAVTGSKDLMKVGGFLGLAGGATSLASGLADSAGGLVVDAAGEGLGGSGGALGQAGDYGMNAAAETGMSGVAPIAGNTANTVIKTADEAGSMFGDATLDSGVGNGLETNSTNAGMGGSSANAPGAGGPGALDAPTMKYGDNSIAPGSPSVPQSIGGAVAPPPATDSGSIQKWWASQPESTKNLILQDGLRAVGGLYQGWSDEQKRALEREQFNLKMSNGSAQPTISFKSKPTGIINSARGV